MPELFNPESIRIQDLTIEQPTVSSELPFEIEHNFTEQDWQEINRFNAEQWDLTSTQRVIDVAADLALIFPERKGEIVIDEDKWGQKIQQLSRETWSFMNIKCAAAMKIVRPDITNELSLTHQNWARLENLFTEVVRHGKGFSIVNLAADIKTFAPEKDTSLRRILSIHDLEDKIIACLQNERANIENAVSTFTSFAASFRIFLPDKWNKLTITPNDWEILKDKLNIAREAGNLAALARTAAQLKIMAAYDVRVTENGIETVKLNLGNQSLDSTLPNQRKF